MKPYNPAHLPAIYDEAAAALGLPRATAGTYGLPYGGDRFNPAEGRQRTVLMLERDALRAAGERIFEDAAGASLSKRQENELAAIEGRIEQIRPLLEKHDELRDWKLTVPAVSGGIHGGGSAPGLDFARGPARSAKYADMFGDRQLSTGGFSSLADFLRPLSMGAWDQRYNALLTSDDANGTGLQIPTQYAAELFDMSLEDEVIRPRAKNYPMTSDKLRIAGFKVGTGGSPFAIAGGWTGEGGTIDTASPQTRAVLLDANGLKALVSISNEAAADGTSTDAQLVELLGRGLGWHLDNGFIRGTGAGEPLGILNSPCLITVSKETSQAADTVDFSNLKKMIARLHPACFNRAIWICNPTTLVQLYEITVGIGTAGQLLPTGPLQRDANGNFSLLTRPVVLSEKASALGDLGDIILADLTQYAVGMRAELRLDKSQHVGFTTDTAYYRAVLRADGQSLWDAAYTPAHGDTQSPFVTLEAR